MKHISFTIISLFATLCCYGQPGVFATHPANDPDGKILTPTASEWDASKLNPELPKVLFSDNSTIAYTLDGKAHLMDIKGKVTDIEKIDVFAKNPLSELVPIGATALASAKNELAYSIDGSLYYINSNKQVIEVAVSDTDGIVYGETVSRNEFGIDGGIFWSPDGGKIAFYRKDETKVSLFPFLDINSRTGDLFSVRYPMAGMTSENITLGIYDIQSKETVYLKVTDFDNERYLTGVTWSPDCSKIYIQVLDRAQDNVHLNYYDAVSGEQLGQVLTEHNDKWVEPIGELHFISENEFVYDTDNRDGYKSLYLCNDNGIIKRLTDVDADVEYLGSNGKEVFYYSFEVSPIERHLFKVNVKNGKTTRLTSGEGWHTVALSGDCSCFVDRYSSLNNPGSLYLSTSDGKKSFLIDNAGDKTEDYAYCELSLGTVKSADGKFDNYYRIIKPLNFDPAKKYPAILYVYGGPHSQMITNSWYGQLRKWEMVMANKGYVVFVMDNRGTPNRGADYEKAIHGACGQAEMADQMVGVKMLMNLPYVDASRIGVHGWSYGGFMTISLLTNYPDVFKVAVAGGPVIDWKWYEVMYGERYMETPQRNPSGFAKTSLINKAKDLKGKLLIIQGGIDNTVVPLHASSFVQECIKNNIPVDYFTYPVSEHNVRGRDRAHLTEKITGYFETHLK